VQLGKGSQFLLAQQNTDSILCLIIFRNINSSKSLTHFMLACL
jgi:hypothetical protein